MRIHNALKCEGGQEEILMLQIGVVTKLIGRMNVQQ